MRYLGKAKHYGHKVYKKATGMAVTVGAAYGFGYVQNRYREKASLYGVPADLASGVALTMASMFTSGAKSALMGDVGRAGVMAYFHTLGAGHGAQKSGVKRLLVPEGDVERAKKALPNATVLGEIPKAPKGDYLSAAELAELAR